MNAIISATKQAEKRNLLSSIFVTLLIGLAYQEMITPVRESIRATGLTWGTFVLFLVFFLTTMRFFIGAQLHLISESLLKLPGRVWFFDFIFIVLEMVVMVLLGSTTSISMSQAARYDFVELLIFLYSLDVLWIVLQWLMGKAWKSWKREMIPSAWAILNLALILYLVISRNILADFHTTLGLWSLLISNGLAFAIDVFLVDYYDVL